MTSLEMINEFYVLLDTEHENFKKGERPESHIVLQYLNIAQVRYLKEIYFKDTIDIVASDISNELQNLINRELVSCTRETATGGPYENLIYYINLSSLSDTFLFYIRSDSLVTRTDINICTGDWVPNKLIKRSDIDKYIDTFYNKPIILNPLVFFENNGGSLRMNILHDSYTTLTTTSGVNVEYIKEPAGMTVSQDCELPLHLHEAIVKFAADIYVIEYKLKLVSNQQRPDKKE